MNHNALLEEMKRLNLTENDALTLLQEARIISDHCLRTADIAAADLSRAVEFLKARNSEINERSDKS